ncbi:AP3B [Lepeophtheirus salmonis]|uniref:AP-3 complex subunit beta n=1 Tax=Lepeophtheirus salmonis TaxID=72036 RepID=A0A7R8GYW1_LEPSM|nr:AP3B [Lepeophtheirus salmonis]CAF2753261.1 AP3B [Lepeophtheirus salmonis]
MSTSYQGGGNHGDSPIPTGISSSSGAMDAIEGADSVSFFSSSSDKKTSDSDLGTMLESSKDSLKLEAMKRIIAIMARGGGGGSTKELFPSVVKNVVSKNVEVKKLVYVYLTRYAEEMPDLALLSISAFQRSLKDPNQLIRASALRVLSSIRVSVVVPIVICALKEASVDMSPFVRKTAAHAIPKVVSLDSETKNELIDVIEKLLGDKTTLVVGSAVMAFSEVCPDRGHYMETAKIIKGFYDEEDGDSTSSSDEEDTNRNKTIPKMDSDHRMLLRSAKPLLQSRNAAVVMSAAQLYFHCAPRPEIQIVSKALIRLLRSHKEVQSIVLNSIATMTSEKVGTVNSMFESYLRNFFVRGSDPTHIKILKLEIITNLATEGNIGIILREFQTYITSQDKVCVGATIQAIGRCASSISDVTDTCLSGLVYLLSNRDQSVVAESVVVIKKLLQTQAGDHKEIIIQMAKLLDTISIPSARGAILWVIGEYSTRVTNVAPDVLKKTVKLVITNPKQTKVIAQYIFNLAKYDANYDVRDRARFLRVFIFPSSTPLLESKFKGRSNYQLGSLSHFLNNRVQGYQDLPEFPREAPDPSVRNVEPQRASNPWDKYLNNLSHHEEVSNRNNYSSKSKIVNHLTNNRSNVTLNGNCKKGNNSSSEDSSEDSSSSSDTSSSDDEVEDSSRGRAQLSNNVKGLCLIPSNNKADAVEKNGYKMIKPLFVSKTSKELLNKIATGGLQVSYRFTRSHHLASSTMTNVELTLLNCDESNTISDIKIGNKNLPSGITLHEFPGIHSILPKQTQIVSLGIDFNDSMQSANFEILIDGSNHQVSISAPVGELVQAISMSEEAFKYQLSKLGGMNEISTKVDCVQDKCPLDKSFIYPLCNVGLVEIFGNVDNYLFAGVTYKHQSFVLISIKHLMENAYQVQINCEKIVFGNLLMENIVKALTSS